MRIQPVVSGAGNPTRQTVSLLEIALLFGRIGITSFGGGISAWMYREVVEKRHWLGEDEFLSGLAFSQILPGANVVNLSIFIGQRLRGALGSLTASSCLLIPPMGLVILLAVGFHRVSDLDWVRDFIEGLAVGAIGLTVSVGVRAARRSTQTQRWPLVLVIAVVVPVGIMHWSLVPVVLFLAPLGIALGWISRNRA